MPTLLLALGLAIVTVAALGVAWLSCTIIVERRRRALANTTTPPIGRITQARKRSF